MSKQITYVIENGAGELFAGVTTGHTCWSRLITKATLFDNKHLASAANKEANGVIRRMKYTLESL